MFMVFKEKTSLLSGSSWEPYSLNLNSEHRTGSWVVELVNWEERDSKDKPTDIFLLDSVKQVVTGVDVLRDPDENA
jgi:hypothetical protein